LPLRDAPLRFLCLSAALLASPGAASCQPDAPPYLETRLRSAVLDEERRLLIRQPRAYEQDGRQRYPVLYKLDGDNQLRSFDESLAELHASGKAPDMIIVAIPNARGQRNRDLTPPSLHQSEGADGRMGTGEMGRGDRFLDFVEKELIPHVEAHYRTTPQRLFVGHSRGALLVLHSLLVKPDLFQARFVFSAPLTRDERRMIADTRKFLAENAGHRSQVYFNWGERENEGMQQSAASMHELLAAAAPKGLRWTIERAPGADHQTTPALAFPAALQWLFLEEEGRKPIRP
jgi:predicted alpha/beta superfamily hydrolase